MTAPAREWQRLGCAALLGAMVAFPAGLMVSGRDPVQPKAPEPRTAPAPARHGTEARKPYSPIVLGDPYVLQRHREIVEALEISCRRTGEGCAEARQARQYLSEREAAPAR